MESHNSRREGLEAIFLRDMCNVQVAADSKSKAMDPKPDASKDPSAGLMDMMKKMYEEGDDEMKRTIAKAWTEGQDKKVKWKSFLQQFLFSPFQGMGGMPGLGEL